jgi:gliding motility-associated-like protein
LPIHVRLPAIQHLCTALLLAGVLCFSFLETSAQCNALSSRRDIFFTPTFGCAPTSVNKFQITYYFTVPQNPATIQILYTWNDPGNNTTTVDLLTGGLVVGGGNTSFSADATFTYVTNNGQCSIRPNVTLIVNGIPCPTSLQMQTAPYWGPDDQANGVVSMAPGNWAVCFDNPVINATFIDNSNFNCNIGVEPDNPNRLQRNVQFVYGTNVAPATTIRNLSLVDVTTKNLTDGTGNLVSPFTRGTPGLLVTGGYFGPVDVVPFPADGPTSVSFPMSAPADVANLIGHNFEITLFNWNVCNPWNGDSVNPNYEDARMTRGYIVIVAAPAPNFDAQDNAGISKRNFCINETIYLANLTPSLGSYGYTWEFFNDPLGTTLLSTSTATNPTFAYGSGGTKLIRLHATNPTAQGSCNEVFDLTVDISPTLVAKIGVTDLSNVPITPYFCQEAAAPFTTFPVRFTDISIGPVTPNTQWRWEFRDENNVLVREEPGPGIFSNTILGPFDLSFINKGIYHQTLITKDKITGCTTTDMAEVRVYEKPVPAFTATNVCEGTVTAFNETSTLNPINGESIVLREWDFNYNGSVFTKDPAYDNQSSFTRNLGVAGLRQVALRVTTDQNSCSQIIVKPVQVFANPTASFTSDVVSGCSILTVNFTNTSVLGQPDVIDKFMWEVDERDGLGFQPISIQHPTDPGFSNVFQRAFENVTGTSIQFDIQLHVVTVNSCEKTSAPLTITVFPGTASGFISTNYSPFNNNCSPQNVNFSVDGPTQALNPSEYQWQVSDINGVISTTSTGTTPSFSYNFTNSTLALKDFNVTLITTLSSGCFGDSTRTIRISPIPSSDFDIDTIAFDCQRLKVRMSAIQKGMGLYHWVIQQNAVPVFSTSGSSDTLTFEFTRPASSSPDIPAQISLDTKNFANCVSAVTSKAVTVPKQDDINASFTVSPVTQSLPNSSVTITNTTLPGAWQYQWNFGDSTKSTSNAATLGHTYATYGTYIISVTVTNNVCIQKQSKAITILAIPPIVDFSYAPPSGCIPLTVAFTNRSKFADPATYIWEFGDGQATSTAINPRYTYFQPGKFSVSLSASNSTGQTIKTTKLLIIEAYPLPNADFDVKPKVVDIPGGILYTSNRSFEATNYEWDFGDGTNSTDEEPQHSYTQEGLYDITLIATNKQGCADTAKVQGAVKVQKGGQILIPNAFTPAVADASGGTSNGKNDVFLPLVRGVRDFELLVFNRWGELLFQSRDPDKGWDGYFNGRLCQQDVYVYKMTATYENGQRIVRIGDVNLIR